MRTRILLLAFILLPSLALAEPLYVQVKSTVLRDSPKHWAAASEKLHQGAQLSKLSHKDGWYSVRTTHGKQGWIHESAVSKKKIVMKSSAPKDLRADSEDVVIAGKGFSEEVERNYRASHGGLNFEAVDAMEHRAVKDSELAEFVKEGKLKG